MYYKFLYTVVAFLVNGKNKWRDARTRKMSLTRDNKIVQSRSLGFVDFKGLTRFTKSLDFNFSEKKTKGGSVRRLRWTGIRADEVIFGKEISTTKRQMFFFLKRQIRVYDPSSEKPLYSTSQYHRQKWSKPTQDVCNVPIQIKLKMIFSPFSWMVKSMKGRERIGSSLADQLGPSALVVYTSSFTVS